MALDVPCEVAQWVQMMIEHRVDSSDKRQQVPAYRGRVEAQRTHRPKFPAAIRARCAASILRN